MKDKKFQGTLEPEWQYRFNPMPIDPGSPFSWRSALRLVLGISSQDFDNAVDSYLG